MVMGKKNTLLYLDENLVRRAKKFGLNLSEVAEAALRERLLPLLSTGELQLDFDQHLKDLKEEGDCYELPIELEGIGLKNVGPLNKLEVKFKRDINVILGPAGSGKSIMIRAIARAFGQRHPLVDEKSLLKHGKWGGEIKIYLRESPAIELGLGKERAKRPIACMLLDEPLVQVLAKDKKKFLAWLKRKGNQVILASRDESFTAPFAHVIRLPAVKFANDK